MNLTLFEGCLRNRKALCRELALPDGGEEKLEPKWIVTVDGRDLWKQED